MANFLSSHDIPRFGEHAGGNFQKTEPVALFQMTYIGLPTIYLRFFVSQFVRLLDYANQCILTAVDGHLPIYYVQPDTHRPKRWQMTDVMDDGPPHPRFSTWDGEDQCPSTYRPGIRAPAPGVGQESMDFDTAVKMNIYETIALTTQAPTSADVAKALSTSPEEVEAALERLHKKRLLVPEPGDPSRIRMAPPFSGIETSFRVKVQDNVYYANCAWDALGIASALQSDAIIEASDGQNGEPMMLEVRNGQPVPEECVIHFAVPAAHWWDDILYT